MTFYIKQNDTRPILSATLVNSDGSAPDLTGSTVVFKMRKYGESSTKVDAAAAVTGATTGVVQYTWSASNTDTVGSYEAEFQVTFSGGGIQTYPNNRYIDVEIVDDIA